MNEELVVVARPVEEEFASLTVEELERIGGGHATVNTI